MTTLTERIAARKPQPQPPKVVSLRPTPIWIKRMQRQGLPAKDYTNGAWTPDGSGSAA